jgi:hypothetical protein
MSALLFLQTLFHGKPPEEHILIWEKTPAKKISNWYSSIDEANEQFLKTGQTQDTYIGCGTSRKKTPQNRRCKADEISGLPAVWLDVDILDPAHQKKNLPADEKQAMNLIEEFPLKPTMIVHSGHGYQCWWVFKKFIVLENQRMRKEFAEMVHRFTWHMRDAARSREFDLDMTFDLSRVFRLPGGRNYKSDPPKPVTLQHCSQDFYTPNQFNDAIQTLKEELGDLATEPGASPIGRQIAPVLTVGDAISLDPMAEPPQDKLDVLCDLEPRFKASWEHSRKDFDRADDSPSAYDMSLATFACNAGWQPQEIVNLLIAFRRKHNLKPKLRQKYYESTLARASTKLQSNRALDELTDMVDADAIDTDEAKEQARTLLRQILMINVRRMIKFMIDPYEYRLESEGASIHIGTIGNMLNQTIFRGKIADATRILPMAVKADQWQRVVQALLNIAEEESAGEDTSNTGMVRHWLHNYLEMYDPLYDLNEAVLAGRPCFAKGCLYLVGPHFRNYIATHWKEVVSSKSMGLLLKEYGMEPLIVNVRLQNNRISTRSVWRVPIQHDRVAQSYVDFDLLRNAEQIEPGQAATT